MDPYESKHRQSFFGLFSYYEMETESCDHSIYITHIQLEQPLGELPAGFKCTEAYLDLKTLTIDFVVSWRPAIMSRPNDLVPDEHYEFTVAGSDDSHLAQKPCMKSFHRAEKNTDNMLRHTQSLLMLRGGWRLDPNPEVKGLEWWHPILTHRKRVTANNAKNIQIEREMDNLFPHRLRKS
jgi:hypothetical protein